MHSYRWTRADLIQGVRAMRLPCCQTLRQRMQDPTAHSFRYLFTEVRRPRPGIEVSSEEERIGCASCLFVLG